MLTSSLRWRVDRAPGLDAMLIDIAATGRLGHGLAAALAADGHQVRRVEDLAPADLAGALVVVAVEGASFGALHRQASRLLDEGRPALFVTIEGECVVAGPVTVPGVTACLECRLRALQAPAPAPVGEPDAAPLGAVLALRTGDAGDVAPATLDDAVRTITGMVGGLDRVVPGRRPFTAAAVFLPGDRTAVPLLPDGRCTACRTATDDGGALAAAAVAEVGEALETEVLEAELGYAPAGADHPDRYRTVGIVGGGTAGYLAALTLKARIPDLDVTLIESSAIPIISVGEATTIEMVKLLHSPDLLGFDIVDFHRRVRPTLKLGVDFQWGLPDGGGFAYPFQYAPLVDAARAGDLDAQCTASLLMAADRAPVVGGPDGQAHSLLEVVRFAYHLDNERFVRFLSEEAAGRGVAHVDATIADVVVTPDGTEVDHLVTDDGRRLRFDLYVDASGFRSLLLEQALGSPFLSYADSLFTDSAIAADEPHDGVVKPYTRAETMPAGWCWTIPFEDADHVGYVYSSAHVDPDQALEDMRKAHPRMGEHRHLRFRSGRHRHFFTGNVVAIGNAYGFVEPLESTALHMVIYEVEHLTNHFPLRHDTATKEALNAKVGGLWDELRWFLAVHYRFNRRMDTPFWDAARADVDISGARERLGVFRERAPLSDRPSLFYSVIAPDFFAGDHAFDTLLLGQGVEGRLGPGRLSAPDWDRRVALRRTVVDRCLGQEVALPLLRDERPELLRRFVEDPRSWVHHWIAR